MLRPSTDLRFDRACVQLADLTTPLSRCGLAQYGGKVTGSVSSKTTFLLLGSELDDGRAPQEGR